MDGTFIDGRYLLLAAIGAGGEARVYRAQDQENGSEVAVRLSQYTTTYAVPAELPAFHEGWAQLLAIGSDPTYGPYHIFELLEGQTLRQLIQSGPLELDAWIDFVNQSVAALEALHESNFVHGDINADNFFLSETGWKLLELPFLRFDPPAGRSAIFGSIHTIAPEQIDGAPATVASDIYSLGCLYYYAASGTYPHPGANSVEVAIHCLRFPPEPLADLAPDLLPVWSDWVMDLIARQPGQRPASLAAARQLLGVA